MNVATRTPLPSRSRAASGAALAVRACLCSAVVRAGFVFATAIACSLPASAQIEAPAKNWVLPLFTAEGYRSAIARGSEARTVAARQFAVTDLNLTFFSGDATARVDTVILSPLAVFEPDTRIARGDQRVRYIRDDLEASGIRWTYWHADKKISLDGDVRVTFRAVIKDLLR